MRDIGKNIRQLRERNGLTQEELAEKLFVTRQTISNYETGRTRPDVDSILRIASVLQTDANTVFYGPPVPVDRRIAYRRLWRASFLLLALGLAAALGHPYSRALRTTQYIVAPSLLLSLVLDPLLLLVLGWWCAHGAGLLLRSSPLTGTWVRPARLALLSLLLASAAVAAPFAVWLCVWLFRQSAAGAVQTGFPYIPVYQQLLDGLLALTRHVPALWALLGGLLRLLGFPQTPPPVGE